MKNISLIYLIAIIAILSGCSFLLNKPSDDQIKEDVRKDLIQYSEYFKIDNIKIEGIIFKKIKDISDKVAIAIVKVRISPLKDMVFREPSLDEIFRDSKYEGKYIPLGFSPITEEKRGKIFEETRQNGYYKSDRGWILGHFRQKDLIE